MADIMVYGLTQNNLKHVTFRIPKEKITVFTGVSGSGKSSIVFDTIAAESQRQMNLTYPAFVRSRLPKYPRPAVERIDNLTPSVVVDQSSLGGNARSTVGTISGLYASLRLLFSRIGQPFVGTASYFSLAFRCLVWVSGSGGGGAGRVVWGYGYHVVVHRRPATA